MKRPEKTFSYSEEDQDGFPMHVSSAGKATNDFFKEDRSAAHAIFDWGPSLTRQDFADECDINVLMKRYELTGVMPTVGVEPRYVDWTQHPSDLMTAMNIFNEAQDAFMQLPAKVRREFDNDPIAFTDYAADPANLDQMRLWGLAPPAEVPDVPRSVGEVVAAPKPETPPVAPQAPQGAPPAKV